MSTGVPESSASQPEQAAMHGPGSVSDAAKRIAGRLLDTSRRNALSAITGVDGADAQDTLDPELKGLADRAGPSGITNADIAMAIAGDEGRPQKFSGLEEFTAMREELWAEYSQTRAELIQGIKVALQPAFAITEEDRALASKMFQWEIARQREKVLSDPKLQGQTPEMRQIFGATDVSVGRVSC